MLLKNRKDKVINTKTKTPVVAPTGGFLLRYVFCFGGVLPKLVFVVRFLV